MRITLRSTHLLIVAAALFGAALIESQYSIVRAAVGRPDLQDTQKKADGSRSVWDGVYTDEQAKRGAPLYSQYCASCHGAELTGGEMAPALVGSDFSNTDILAYILSANTFPAGISELARETEVLNQIRFQSLKPQ